jgi:Integrase core domain
MSWALRTVLTEYLRRYNTAQPHQSLGMATPASLFRPGVSLDREPVAASARQAEPAAAGPVPRLVLSPPGGAVEFETVISPAGLLAVLPRVQRIRMGQALAGQVARVWADEGTVHVTIAGPLVKTAASASALRTWPSCGCAARPRQDRRPRAPRPPAAPCPPRP